MIIVSAADERFAPHFCTMLHSAWTLHPYAEYHLIDCDILPATRAKIIGFAVDNRIELHITKFTEDQIGRLPTTRDWSIAMYARLLVPYLIPEADRAIYLDADTVVVGELLDLWQTDLQNCPVAGVYDRFGAATAHQRDYINSGVLLMDLVAWRAGKIPEWSITYAVAKQPRFPDQDAINATCRGHIHMLPRKWNFMLGDNIGPPEDPRVLHWNGPVKPWYYHDAVCASIYLFHRQLTPFPLDSPSRAWRSWPRMAANLVIGRPKYWRRMRMHAACRPFMMSYLRSVVA